MQRVGHATAHDRLARRPQGLCCNLTSEQWIGLVNGDARAEPVAVSAVKLKQFNQRYLGASPGRGSGLIIDIGWLVGGHDPHIPARAPTPLVIYSASAD